MLSRYNPIDVERILRTTAGEPPFPPIENRAAWDEVRTRLGDSRVREAIRTAEHNASEPVPALPATLFLEYQRTGQREGFQTPRSRRREILSSLTIVECLENSGRFLDAALDVAWAICEESSWALPAHQIELTDIDRPVIDLGAAMTALELAEFAHLLGGKLDPLARKRISDEVDRRCFTPYLTRHDFWWLYNTRDRRVNNWTAVCNAGVVGAALYLEPDPARLAAMIAKCARSMDDYLETFDPDGGSSEGPGYWSYGFGFYTVLAHLLAERTGGGIELLDGELFRKTSRYPLATVLSRGLYVNFSDCDRRVGFSAPHLAFLSRRLDVPELMPLAREQPRDKKQGTLAWGLRSLFWRPADEPAGESRPARHDWFSGMQWMVARYDPADPSALVLAAKGGHNAEMHNQNDVGTVIVHVGEESLIADVGRGRYTKAYFGPTRYEHFVNASSGHSIPLPNACAQPPGAESRAEVLEHATGPDRDVLELELKNAFPSEADLASLVRRVVLRRDVPKGAVEITDTVRFASKAGTFQSRFTTFAGVEIGADTVVLRGENAAVRMSFDAAVVESRLETEKNIDLSEGPGDVNIVVFELKTPSREATVALSVVPL